MKSVREGDRVLYPRHEGGFEVGTVVRLGNPMVKLEIERKLVGDTKKPHRTWFKPHELSPAELPLFEEVQNNGR